MSDGRNVREENQRNYVCLEFGETQRNMVCNLLEIEGGLGTCAKTVSSLLRVLIKRNRSEGSCPVSLDLPI